MCHWNSSAKTHFFPQSSLGQEGYYECSGSVSAKEFNSFVRRTFFALSTKFFYCKLRATDVSVQLRGVNASRCFNKDCRREINGIRHRTHDPDLSTTCMHNFLWILFSAYVIEIPHSKGRLHYENYYAERQLQNITLPLHYHIGILFLCVWMNCLCICYLCLQTSLPQIGRFLQTRQKQNKIKLPKTVYK